MNHKKPGNQQTNQSLEPRDDRRWHNQANRKPVARQVRLRQYSYKLLRSREKCLHKNHEGSRLTNMGRRML